MAQCTAKSKQSGERCKRHAKVGMTVCKIHGGNSPVGIASPSFKTGKYSRAASARYKERYEAALGDQTLLDNNDDIAFAQARTEELIEHLDERPANVLWAQLKEAWGDYEYAEGEADPKAMKDAARKMGRLIEEGGTDKQRHDDIRTMQRHMAVMREKQTNREVDLALYIHVDDVEARMTLIQDIIRRHISDPKTLQAIASDFRALDVE